MCRILARCNWKLCPPCSSWSLAQLSGAQQSAPWAPGLWPPEVQYVPDAFMEAQGNAMVLQLLQAGVSLCAIAGWSGWCYQQLQIKLVLESQSLFFTASRQPRLDAF